MSICDVDKCTGCGACYSVCPAKCITMEYDQCGFLFPKIDDQMCIKCNKCREVCPSLNVIENNNSLAPTAIGCWHKDENVVKRSSSGGAFTAIAEYIFENNGVVIGCVMDNDLTPYHTVARNLEELKLMHGSKYLQSEIRDIYIKTKELLDDDIMVLFTGCPCQVAGLYAYLNNNFHTNLITVDLICHGVGSKTFYDEYINEMGSKYNDKVCDISFRNKIKPGKSFVTKISFLNRPSIYIPASKDAYMSCYLQRAIYRESCYNCRYASIPRIADISIGDFSGIDKSVISRDVYNKGVSVLLLNNNKAIKLFRAFNKNLNWIERPLIEAKLTNLNIYKASVRPNSRTKIFDIGCSPSEAKKKYCKLKLRVRLANIIGEDKIRLIKKVFSRI